MITKQELIKKHKELNLPLPTIEKDYILGLILACLYHHPVIQTQWVFKGGTCLKKIYLKDYRFSEDLDFTLTDNASVNPQEIEKYLLEAFTWGAITFGLIIDRDNINISPFPDKAGLFIQVKVPFQSPLMSAGSLPRVKFDLSKTEKIIDAPYLSPLLHFYSDADLVTTTIKSYSMDEIFAEKCRALVERTRPRDLYDVIHLYENFYSTKTNMDNFLGIINLKFQHRGLSFPNDLLKISHEQFEDTKDSWRHMLSHQITPLDDIQVYIEKYQHIVRWIINLPSLKRFL